MRKHLSHLKNAVLAKRLAFIPGHFYSPICDPAELRSRYRDPNISGPVELPGIDLNARGQIERLMRWRPFLADARFPETPQPDRRYKGNRLYGVGDAIPLYCFIRELRPRRIIEIGSGFSSACMLDTADSLDLDIDFTFIDPYSGNLDEFLRSEDRKCAAFMRVRVQDAPLTTFDALEAGDMLIIDSTHVLKTCSDVAFELFTILPALKPGVFIHFHDIFYPFEYPSWWVLAENYSWNEAYALRALLMYQSRFRIEFWNHYLAIAHADVVQREAPDLGAGGSLWLSRA